MERKASWEMPTEVGEVAIVNHPDGQLLSVADSSLQWSRVATESYVAANSAPEPHQALEALQMLVSSGVAQETLEPMIRSIIDSVINERQAEQPMFEL